MNVNQEDFKEVASKEKLKSRAEREKGVFEPFQTEGRVIFTYLSALFEKIVSNQALRALKKSMKTFENQLAALGQFNHGVPLWTIKDLLSSDLLTDDKRAVLEDFKADPTILDEVADVLNMRMAALDTWSWGDSVPVELRKNFSGTYGIYMHEDLLLAILLQYIGVKWPVFLKGVFKTSAHLAAWISLRAEIPVLEKRRREYFLGPQVQVPSLQCRRQAIHRFRHFIIQLMDSVVEDIEVAGGDK